jgi:Tol biopolymer transport system component
VCRFLQQRSRNRSAPVENADDLAGPKGDCRLSTDPSRSPRTELHDGTWRICIHDIERGVTTRLTEGMNDWHPSWSDNGKRIIYAAQTEGHMQSMYEIPADASGRSKALLEPGLIAHSSPDGNLVYARFDGGQLLLAVYSPLDGETTSLGPGVDPQLSPDGKWIAYTVTIDLIAAFASSVVESTPMVLPLDQPVLRQSFQHPGKDQLVRFSTDQPPGARNRHVIRRVLVQSNGEKLA